MTAPSRHHATERASTFWPPQHRIWDDSHVQPRPGSLAPALAPGVSVADTARDALRARVPTSTAQRVVGLAIVPMVATTLALALASDHREQPVAAGIYLGYLVAASMGI